MKYYLDTKRGAGGSQKVGSEAKPEGCEDLASGDFLGRGATPKRRGTGALLLSRCSGGRRDNRSRGDATILYTFITLMIIIVTTFVVAKLVTTTMRGTSSVNWAAQAFYAASTGIERAYYDYVWDTSGTGDTCVSLTDEQIDPANTVVTYDIIASGDPWDTGQCPTSGDVASGSRAFCATAIGKAMGIQRRVENDTNRVLCRP